MSFVPHSATDRAEMLRAVGVDRMDDLYTDIPDALRLGRPLDLPDPLSEWEAARRLAELADANFVGSCFAGGGMYDHYTPAALDHLIRRSEFYTAYTPYQPEVSQGTLQTIYEFQTLVCELTGMHVANASIYDGASATAEAALMAMAVTGRDRLVVAGSLHPHYLGVVETYTSGQESEIVHVPAGADGLLDSGAVTEILDDATAAVVVQNPNFFGAIEPLEQLAEAAHGAGALLVVAVPDAISLGLLRTPGECGADIVASEGQAFGIPPSFGGPVVGLFASRDKFVRRMPGRIVGATVDEEGRRGYVLTLQTREQQIRRAKATSNICTNQGLFALAATIHLTLLGPEGLRTVAETSVRNAYYARDRLVESGVELLFPDAPFFREFAVRVPDSRETLARGLERGILAGVSLARFPGAEGDGLLLAFTEKHVKADIDALVETIAETSGGEATESAAASAAR